MYIFFVEDESLAQEYICDISTNNSEVLSFSDPCLTSWISSLGLTMEDKECLVNNRWLSANHISAYQGLLRQAFPHTNGLQDTCSLAMGKWESVAETFVQVIYISPGHWACLSDVFSRKGVVDLYDSMHTTPGQDSSIVNQVCTILQSQQPCITIDIVNVMMQRGGSDCGLFALAMAADLCRGVDPYQARYTQDRMREHLRSDFDNLRVSCFPASLSQQKQRCFVSVSYEIFCICRKPESYPMAGCDTCGQWYHSICLDIPPQLYLTMRMPPGFAHNVRLVFRILIGIYC